MLGNKPINPDLPVVDLQRARGFYEEKLGLRPMQSSDHDVMYECGNNTMLYLYMREPTQISHTEVTWTVDDIMAEVNELKSKGVDFETYDMPEMGIQTDENNIARINGWRTAWFKDTEGNILSLSQRAA